MLKRGPAWAWLIAAVALAACQTPSPVAPEADGPYLVLEVNTASLSERMLESVADTVTTELREADPEIDYVERSVVGDAARVRLADPADLERARAIVHRLAHHPDTNDEMLSVSVEGNDTIVARFTSAHLRILAHQTILQSIEIIRRRTDPADSGTVEVVQRGDRQILVRAPVGTDPRVLRQGVGVTGNMTFHVVLEVSPEDAAMGRLPPEAMLAQPYPHLGAESMVVERRPQFTGARLVRANATTDRQTGQSAIAFGLDTEGTREFCRITREHVGQRFAILLDDQVITAPRINEPICGGAGQISGSFTPQSASDLAVILRAGALPTPLIIVEEGVTPARR